MTDAELRDLLEVKYRQFNTPDFIAEDPVRIPHQFDKKEDIEISGFLTALIAWGQRKTILNNAERLMDRMDRAPYQYIMQAGEEELGRLDDFVHRTFNGIDAVSLVHSLRHVYEHLGGLEAIFSEKLAGKEDVYEGIVYARSCLISVPDFPKRTHKHVANPAKGSSAKLINMFLRWMVRKDLGGVDFGIWKKISPSQLICPLDVHTGNVARKLGILERKQNDWKAASALTARLRTFCSEDPVRFDFSLFGLGVYDKF